MFGWGDRSPQRGEARVDARRALAIAATALGASPEAAPDLDPVDVAADAEAARAALEDWCERTGAPAIELRRAGRRLAGVLMAWLEAPAGAADGVIAACAAACAEPDARAAARGIIDALAVDDRDFAWDVPLRDIARVGLAAAIDVARRD